MVKEKNNLKVMIVAVIMITIFFVFGIFSLFNKGTYSAVSNTDNGSHCNANARRYVEKSDCLVAAEKECGSDNYRGCDSPLVDATTEYVSKCYYYSCINNSVKPSSNPSTSSSSSKSSSSRNSTSVSSSSKTPEPDNPDTGTSFIAIAWFLGIFCLVLSYFYIKRNSFE